MTLDCRANGFGRYIASRGHTLIGWWKDSNFYGNGVATLPSGKVEEEGWFHEAKVIDGYKKDDDEYPYFNSLLCLKNKTY